MAVHLASGIWHLASGIWHWCRQSQIATAGRPTQEGLQASFSAFWYAFASFRHPVESTHPESRAPRESILDARRLLALASGHDGPAWLGGLSSVACRLMPVAGGVAPYANVVSCRAMEAGRLF
ncbi:hypothetical protein EG329_004235 [Mollisiaceae sp. DMI_Dod_QoI]|nr:hypothetical protein EG329_004235 [Helotiales sp. DMI_Dod_QoI]